MTFEFVGRRKPFSVLILFLASGLLSSCNLGDVGAESAQDVPQPIPNLNLPSLQKSAKFFASCDEITTRLQLLKAVQATETKRYTDWSMSHGPAQLPDAPPVAAHVATSSASAQPTNVQEIGIDEGDRVKITDDLVFIAQTSSVQIIDRATKEVSGALQLDDLFRPELYTTADRLIVIGSARTPSRTIAKFYALHGAALPTLLSQTSFDGDRLGTRLEGSRLLLVFNLADAGAVAPTGGKFHNLPCERVHAPVVDDFDFRLTAVYSYDVESPSAPIDELGAIGGGDQIYVSESAIYNVKNGVQWLWSDPRSEVRDLYEQSVLSKIELNSANGHLDFGGVGAIHGLIRNRLDIKESADHSSLIATVTERDANWLSQNRVVVLGTTAIDGELQLQSQTAVFGSGETVRSTRFRNDQLYVVTFAQTDPLFTFDLSDLDHPALRSRLTAPGFSAYLHEVGGDHLIGVGYNTGIQFSLFDITRPFHPVLLEQKENGTSGSSALVSEDSHAFFVDEDHARVAVPSVVYRNQTNVDGGATVLKVSANGFVPEAFLSHAELIPRRCWAQSMQYRFPGDPLPFMDVERVFNLGADLVTVSRFGVKFFDVENLNTLNKTTAFTNNDDECLAAMSPYVDPAL